MGTCNLHPIHVALLLRCVWVHIKVSILAKDNSRHSTDSKSWKVCQTFSWSQQTEILMPHEVPQGLWEKIRADFFVFESTNYLLIANYYSQFPIIRRIRSTITNATIDVMKQVFSTCGVPKTEMSDQGPQFLSKELKAFANQYWIWPHHIKPEVPTDQWHDRTNGVDSEAVSKDMHGSRTWSLPSYVHLQGKTTVQQPTRTSRAAEWKDIQGTIVNKKIDAECPQTECERADGWWQGKKCWTLQQISKRPTTPTHAAEGLCSSQP